MGKSIAGTPSRLTLMSCFFMTFELLVKRTDSPAVVCSLLTLPDSFRDLFVEFPQVAQLIKALLVKPVYGGQSFSIGHAELAIRSYPGQLVQIIHTAPRQPVINIIQKIALS